MGIYIAMALVVIFFIGALVMQYVRNNETYEDILPPDED